jgi:deoxycytidine triphosphate deaminase/intein/homing endonuclease
MSIKSDRWIRRMATQGMIEPFSPDQVRVSNGHKIVSYGTSSYGYDVRCADDFKIFTNINSTIVDPKAFDEKSFVDFKGPVCIIPPNSFALASTVEYFRIPRSVLTVCLGKCVTGDTRVVDADSGAYLPITDMRFGKSTLGLDDWKLKPAKVSAFIPQGRKEVFELRTRAGLRIRATANHPFRQLNGWTPLSELRPGDRIAAARNIPVFGKTPIPDWEASLLGLMISKGQCNTPGHGPTYTTADSALVQEKYGLSDGAAERFVPQAVFTATEHSVRLFLQSLFSGAGGIHGSKGVFLEVPSSSRRLVEDVHHLLLRFGIFSLIRENSTSSGIPACGIQITDDEQILRFAEKIGFTRGSAKQKRLEVEARAVTSAQRRDDSESFNAVACGAGGSLTSIDIETKRSELAPSTADSFVSPLIDGPVWDVVEQIESVGVEEVFDISVPVIHNFVANDLIVHNSTYARCFRGDTRVALVDGTSPTLEDMAKRAGSGEIFWGYSIGANGRLIVSLLDAPRFIGRDALLEVELDDGAVIHATPDHLFMRRDGRMVEAHELRANDALMPLYRDLSSGYEQVYQPADGLLHATHRLAGASILRQGVRARHSPRMLDAWAGDRAKRDIPGTPTYRNHKVAAIRALAGDHDVYCLTVPEAGNFALQAGVFVHNCGIIVNVTPLEPEWEGHVTLEFSNTTPLPAKIYANEGVAQMLFFESDEICETSYADRGGKYQGQRGVTLPKT